MTEYIAERIKDADLILVGVGEELDVLPMLKKDLHYQDETEKIKDSWILPFVDKIKLEELEEERKECYDALAACLEGRNYFIVSLCQDGLIGKSGLREDRIVEPCGGYQKLQCSKACSTDLYDISTELLEQIRIWTKSDRSELTVKEPVCPKCGSPLIFNQVNASCYLEEGYMEQWLTYKKWLQGTVNKKVCILELGVGMKYPTVIRWPFEKIVFFNQKAELFRVHSRLYQISEEIKGKAQGICRHPEEFLKELSNAL